MVQQFSTSRAFLYPDYGDRLCDVGEFSEALRHYCHAMAMKKWQDEETSTTSPTTEEISFESLQYFIRVASKLNSKLSRANMAKAAKTSATAPGSPARSEAADEDMANEWTSYMTNPGEPSADPWSCPRCFGVLVDPVSLPCGHTYCRIHVFEAKDSTSNSTCLKVLLSASSYTKNCCFHFSGISTCNTSSYCLV